MAKENDNQETRSLEEIKTENKNLYKKLTNKNQNYMFQLNSRLDELEYDKTKREYVFNAMLHEIIAGQASSVPARRIYGTVSEQADNILGKNVDLPQEEGEKSPTWMLYLDGALLMGGLFNIINGLSAWRSPIAENQVGLLQVILNFLIGGVAVLVLTKFAPTPGETRGLLKYGFATVGVVIAWIILMAAVIAMFPTGSTLNPMLPGLVVLGIGVIALIAKWFVKRKLGIQGTLF